MEKKKPDFETALNGVRLAGWEHEKDGRRWPSFSPSKRIVDPENKEVKYVQHYSLADLVLLREEIDQGIAWAKSLQAGPLEE
jgi:hypothetical protein